MSKTLLILNGQPVILTSVGADSLVQDNVAFTSAIAEAGVEAQDSVKVLLDEEAGQKSPEFTETRLDDTTGLDEALHQNLVQVKVSGSEEPGFLLNPDTASPSVHKLLGLPPSQKDDYDLLGSVKVSSEDNTSKDAGFESGSEFLQLHSASPQSSSVKQSGFGGQRKANYSGDVFGDLLQSNSQTRGSDSDGDTSIQNLQNVLQFPLVSNEVQELGTVGGEATGEQSQPKSVATLIAIIQGEDGTTQTIELSQEEACKLNLSHLFTGGEVQMPLDSSHMQGKDVHEPSTSSEVDTIEQAISVVCKGEPQENGPSVFPMKEAMEGTAGGVVEENTTTSDSDVNLGPFLLIPEYNADGSISMLQLRGSHSDTTTEIKCDESFEPDSTPLCSLQGAQELHDKNALSFLHPGPQNSAAAAPMQKQMKPLSSELQQDSRKQSNKGLPKKEFKTTMPAASQPKVPGSTYLRDIAKKTKFKKLTSFLNRPRVNMGNGLVKKEVLGTGCGASAPVVTSLPSIMVSTQHSFTIPSAPTVSMSTIGNTIQEKQTVLNSEAKMSSTLQLPMHTSSTASSLLGESERVQEEPGVGRDRALTIKVSTGPLAVSDSFISPTTQPTPIPATTTTATTPSIRCADYSEGASVASDSPSLTSIVYCSPGGEDTPFTVHLPGGDNTKPLGSSENPIQLVQQGNTFQALQPVQERQLEQITALLQQRRLSAPSTAHHDEIYDPKTNMKIVYKVVFPEDMMAEEEDDEEGEWPWEARLGEEKKRGRKPKDSKKNKASEDEEIDIDMLDEEEEDKHKQAISRTRSGRISRPPRHMLDFRHMPPASLNGADPEKEPSDLPYSGLPLDQPPPISQFSILDDKTIGKDNPKKKKREVPTHTRLRYTCLTCGKLYMGRIEAHYRKYPDHRRPTCFLPQPSPKQTYSTLKTLSDPSRGLEEVGGEVNKSVLSPTPGTQASETIGEPGLPMETLTPQPLPPPSATLDPLQPLNPESVGESEGVKPAPAGRPWRGRGRRGRRGRRGGRTIAPPPPKATHTEMLEKLLVGCSPQDIQQAVGRRLVENLSPWKLLCFQADKGHEVGGSWGERLRNLDHLLADCRKEFQQYMELTQEPPHEAAGTPRHPLLQEAAGDAFSLPNPPAGLCAEPGAALEVNPEHLKETRPEEGRGGASRGVEGGSSVFQESSLSDEEINVVDTPKKVVENVMLSESLAVALGLQQGTYKEKEDSNCSSPPTVLSPASQDLHCQPCSHPNTQASHPTTSQVEVESTESTQPTPSNIKRSHQTVAATTDETSTKRLCRENQEDGTFGQPLLTTTLTSDEKVAGSIMGDASDGSHLGVIKSEDSNDVIHKVLDDVTRTIDISKKAEESVDCIHKALEDATRHLDLSKKREDSTDSIRKALEDIARNLDLSKKNEESADGIHKMLEDVARNLELSKKGDDGADSIIKALEDATRNLDLSLYSLPSHMSQEPSLNSTHLQTSTMSPSLLSTSEGSTRSSSMAAPLTSPHFNLPISSEGCLTRPTMSHTAPCVAQTSAMHASPTTTSLPLHMQHFSTNHSQASSLSSCLPMQSMETSLIPTSTLPHVVPIQPLPMGDLDITAEDLPRLLSEGTGLVVGSGGDSCDAPKLLDTSTDTTDLSEMLFKLQEATVGIGQGQLGSSVYQEQMLGETQVVSSGTTQLLTSQSLDVDMPLPALHYSSPHHSHGLNMKSEVAPSMPLLTFSGALESTSDFHSNPTSHSQVVGAEEKGKIEQVGLGQLQGRVAQGEAGLRAQADQVNMEFNVAGLESSTLEELFKR